MRSCYGLSFSPITLCPLIIIVFNLVGGIESSVLFLLPADGIAFNPSTCPTATAAAFSLHQNISVHRNTVPPPLDIDRSQLSSPSWALSLPAECVCERREGGGAGDTGTCRRLTSWTRGYETLPSGGAGLTRAQSHSSRFLSGNVNLTQTLSLYRAPLGQLAPVPRTRILTSATQRVHR